MTTHATDIRVVTVSNIANDRAQNCSRERARELVESRERREC
jgi:hypothetical protein